MKSKYINVHFNVKDEFIELAGVMLNGCPFTRIADNENELIVSSNPIALLFRAGD